MTKTESPKGSFVGSILDEYEKTKEKKIKREEQEVIEPSKMCKCILF